MFLISSLGHLYKYEVTNPALGKSSLSSLIYMINVQHFLHDTKTPTFRKFFKDTFLNEKQFIEITTPPSKPFNSAKKSLGESHPLMFSFLLHVQSLLTPLLAYRPYTFFCLPNDLFRNHRYGLLIFHLSKQHKL